MPDILGCFGGTLLGGLKDASQAIRQYFNLLVTKSPGQHATDDAAALANAIYLQYAGGRGVVVVAHSQGNLVASEAIQVLKVSRPDFNPACLAVVSIAPPMRVGEGGFSGGQAHVQDMIIRDGLVADILAVIPGMPNLLVPSITNEFSEKLKAQWWQLVPGFTYLAGAGLHLVESSYFGMSRSRATIVSALKSAREYVEGHCTVAKPPTIRLSQASLAFSTTIGGGLPLSQTIAISNAGAGPLAGLSATSSYSSGQPSGWLTATLSGSVAPATLTLSASAQGMSAGTYTASVAVASTASGVTNSPQAVKVTMSVSGTPSGPCPTPITISRNIDTATTLVSGVPGCAHYRVAGRISVAGALTIQAGTVIAMAAGARLTVFGSLSALGTQGQPIVFQGEQATRGYWEAIQFASSSPLNELRYVEVRHGGGGTAAVRANVVVGGSDALNVRASRFEESAGAGLWIHDLAILRGFSANTFRANALSGLHISAEHIGALDAASVYADSNGTPFVDVEGTQVRQTQAWNIAGVPLRMTGVTTIRSDVSIGPGVQLWMGQSASFVVWGSLSAVGSPAARITIRGEQPLRGYWQSIMFGSKSALNRMTEVSVRHGGGTTNRLAGSITVANNSLLQIERTEVEESATAGVWVDDFAELRTWTANVG